MFMIGQFRSSEQAMNSCGHYLTKSRIGSSNKSSNSNLESMMQACHVNPLVLSGSSYSWLATLGSALHFIHLPMMLPQIPYCVFIHMEMMCNFMLGSSNFQHSNGMPSIKG